MFENKKFHVNALRLAAVLLVLVMMTTSMVAGRYARYTTTVSGSDSARVAKYQITVNSPSDDNLTLSTDTPTSYSFTVTSDSEVAVEYDLVVSFKEVLPENISLSLSKDGTETVLTSDNHEYTVPIAGTFDPQGGTHTYTLIFTAEEPIGAGTLSEIYIRVDARQVD